MSRCPSLARINGTYGHRVEALSALGSAVLQPAGQALFACHARMRLSTSGREGVHAGGFYRQQGWEVAAARDGGKLRWESARPMA